MTDVRILPSVTVLAAVVAACSSQSSPNDTVNSSGGNPPTTTTPQDLGTLPCDVDKVLATNCRSCHGASPLFGAPMPLVTRADLFGTATSGKKYYEQMGVRIHDDARPMPQPPNARLSTADTATLDNWIAAGAPAGSGTCDNQTTTTAPQPLSCNPDQKIRPASAFSMPKENDLYVCYGFDTDATTKRHVIAGAPRIDNPNIVHHVLLYQADAAVSPTPTPCGAGGGTNWRLVTGWAPGAKNFELPPEAGFAEEQGTTHWAVQIHYNNIKGLDGQLDSSGYDLCSTDQLRPNDADILATGTVKISIPPRSTTTTTCDLTIPSDFGSINVVSSWAHMHLLGRAQSAKRVRAGADMSLLDAPNYDFYTGAGANTVNVDLTKDDHVVTTCKWSNAGDKSVGFGENTEDEMCFAFLTYYPKIRVQNWHWAIPSVLGKCTTSNANL